MSGNYTHTSIKGFKKGTASSIPSMFARDCTIAMGMMKKKVRKKNTTPIINRLIARLTKGMARLLQ